MVNTVACVMALLIQLIAPASWLIHNVTPAAGSVVAGHFITVSLFNILLDITIFPERYRRLTPPNFLKFLEFLFSILVMEFFGVVVWTRIELFIEKFFKCTLINNDLELYEAMGGDWLPNAFVIALSLLIFVMTTILTGQMAVLRCHYQHVKVAIQRAWQQRNEINE